MVPNPARRIINFKFPFSILNPSLLFTIIRKAIKKATRFRKKLFCTEGRSPESRTNTFINVKHNADNMINKIPLYLEFMARPSFLKTFIVFIQSFILAQILFIFQSNQKGANYFPVRRQEPKRKRQCFRIAFSPLVCYGLFFQSENSLMEI